VVRGKVVLIGGGARSGKSALALRFGRALGERRAFVATAQAFDDEMRVRIERHRQERVGEFDTFEAPEDLAGALRALNDYDVVVVDCVTHWVSNLLLAGLEAEAILQRVEGAVEALGERRFHAVVVTNEVGMSIHPPTPLGRAFVEVNGWANQRFVERCDEVYFAVMGAVLPIRQSDLPPRLSSL
jgi:adenosylcobinamide kinase / adenosylcobinamide-phosphate guanylyltransferase